MSETAQTEPDGGTEMTPAQLAEAKQYGRIDLALSLADKALDLLFLGLFAYWAAGPLDAWLKGFCWLGSVASLRVVVFFALMTLTHIAVSLPLSFYSGHIVEHRFKLSTLTLGGWIKNYAKRNALAATLGAVLTLGVFWLIWTAGGWWWLAAAGASFAVSIVLGRLAPVLILPWFYKIERLDDPALTDRMAGLAEGTGLTIEGVYRMGLSNETVKANAMLAGMGSTRRVLLGDTLLDGFTPDEITVIFAHEIGHHVFRHIQKMVLVGLLLCVAGFYACDWVLRLSATDGQVTYAELPVSTLPLLTLCMTVFGFLMEPLLNVVSRRHERQCDRYALRRTGLSDAYRSAFQKLAKLNKEDPCPHWIEVLLFHSHPPIGERLALTDEMPENSGSAVGR